MIDVLDCRLDVFDGPETLRYKALREAVEALTDRLDQIRHATIDHQARLVAYLQTVDLPATASGVLSSFVARPTARAPEWMPHAYVAFSLAVLKYAELHELALRLHELPLREIAPKHMKTYADGARAIAEAFAAVVASDLAAKGFDCRCVCPMCGLGVCGCVAAATTTLLAALQVPQQASDGFVIQPPRRGSQMAAAGMLGGERLLRVDGLPVASIPEIQGAIRKHSIGDEVTLTIEQGSQLPREIRVRHVSDNAPAPPRS